jgi:hypothetical protein
VLYLQSTPMTEPLLFGCSFLALATTATWIANPTVRHRSQAGWALVALTLTRYEGWAIAGGLLVIAAAAGRGRGRIALLPYVGGAIGAFLVLGWASTGQWLVSSGFFVPDNPTRHDLMATLADVVSSTRELAGPIVLAAALAGAIMCVVHARRTLVALLPLALFGAAVLPLAAFYQGHPHRIRYMVPLAAAAGVAAGVAVSAVPRRAQVVAAAGLVAAACYSRLPFDAAAPMVTEAQWETPFKQGRMTVSAYLDGAYDHTPILASMGSLGHYMQETASHGLHVANFVHEGNGDLWLAALVAPRHYVRWLLIEERAEGGDLLAARARSDSAFLKDFARVATGGGLVLYKRAY